MFRQKKSHVWNYFKKLDNNKEAVCSKCSKILGCKGSTTTPLINHLKIHGIVIVRPNFEEEVVSKKPKIENSTILDFIKPTKPNSLGAILSRCAAKDGMSVRAIRKSEAVKGYLEYKKLKMPASEATIWKYIYDFYNQMKKEMILQIELYKNQNGKFSITVDEWTDNSAIRYINVSLRAYHSSTKLFENFDLGLVEIKEKADDRNTEIYIKQKLKDFNIDMDVDIVASTHDGAAVMVKYGNNISAISQLCHNHALHLAIIDSLYKNKYSEQTYSGESFCLENEDNLSPELIDIDSDSEYSYSSFNDENDDNKSVDYSDFQIENTNLNLQITEDCLVDLNTKLYIVVNKVRKIVKMFRKSPAKNNKLQEYVLKQENKKLHLLIDVKTRWNSMATMIRRFLRLKDCINHTLVEIAMQTMSESDILVLQNLLNVLTPLEVAVKELSKDNVTLITVEGVYKFLFNSFTGIDNDLSNILLIEIKKRMEQRRDKTLTTLLIYLDTGTFNYASKSSAKDLAENIMQRIYNNNDNNTDNNTDTDNDDDVLLTAETEGNAKDENELQKQLHEAICSITTISRNVCGSVESSTAGRKKLTKDFNFLDAFNKRTNQLNILYNGLLTISPTSTATERVFSTAGIIKSKLRSSLKFKNLNAILFLKCIFNKEDLK